MMDDTAQNQTPTLSYVDNYAPPTQPVMPPAARMQPSMPSTPTTSMPPAMSMPSMPVMPADLQKPPIPSASSPTLPFSEPSVDTLEDAASAAGAIATPTEATPSGGQTLEEQNIFQMLGAGEASDEEKESFLDELQQVIWEDFLENDVELLITEAEKAELKAIQDKTYPSDLEKQEAIVVYLEKLIPDLEDIMLEKALELKRDMFMERLAGMKDMYAGQTDKLATIAHVEELVSQDTWKDAVETLNKVA